MCVDLQVFRSRFHLRTKRRISGFDADRLAAVKSGRRNRFWRLLVENARSIARYLENVIADWVRLGAEDLAHEGSSSLAYSDE